MKPILLPLIGLLLLAGCNTVNTVESQQRPMPNIIADQRIVTDDYLHEYLSVGPVGGSIRPTPAQRTPTWMSI